MANNFVLTITAVDKATAVAKKVNESIAKITKPIHDVRTSVAAFNKETGLDRLGKGLVKVGRSAEVVARKVASISPPMAALVGVGTIAGIAALANSWGHAAMELGNTSHILGISTTQLQQYRGAARLAGLSADDMTGSLKSLGSTFEDAASGRNVFAAGVLLQKGIGIHRLKNGAIDTTRALHDIANAMQKIHNPQAQQKFADVFGVGALLPLLQKGGAGIDAYVAKFNRLNALMTPAQIAQGEKYNENMVALDFSIDKLRNSIGASLTPALTKMVNEFARLADQYGPRITAWLNGVNWDKVAGSIANVVTALGGVKGIAIGLAAITFAGPIAGLASLVTKAAALSGILLPLVANPLVAGLLGLTYSKGLNTGEDAYLTKHRGKVWDGDPIGQRRREGAAADPQTEVIFNKLRALGWTTPQAAGIAANLWRESLYDPNAVGDNGHAYGVAQWHEDRQADFKKLFGISMRKSSLDQQLKFLTYELRQGKEKIAGRELLKAQDAEDAGAAISMFYERPANASDEAVRRGNIATSIMSSLYAKRGRDFATRAGEAISSPSGRVDVHIHMPNAPQGTRATVKSASEQVAARVHIGHSGLFGPNV